MKRTSLVLSLLLLFAGGCGYKDRDDCRLKEAQKCNTDKCVSEAYDYCREEFPSQDIFSERSKQLAEKREEQRAKRAEIEKLRKDPEWNEFGVSKESYDKYINCLNSNFINDFCSINDDPKLSGSFNVYTTTLLCEEDLREGVYREGYDGEHMRKFLAGTYTYRNSEISFDKKNFFLFLRDDNRKAVGYAVGDWSIHPFSPDFFEDALFGNSTGKTYLSFFGSKDLTQIKFSAHFFKAENIYLDRKNLTYKRENEKGHRTRTTTGKCSSYDSKKAYEEVLQNEVRKKEKLDKIKSERKI